MPYLTLEEIPEGRLCRPLFIPDDAGWLALFGGALTELTKTWNYEQFGALTPQEMVDECQAIIEQWYADMCGDCELPDGDPILRGNEEGHIEQLVDGEWVEPQGDYYLPPPAARTEPTSDERMCLAAANATNALKQMYEEVTDAYQENLSLLLMIAEVAIFVGGFVFPALGLVVKGLGAVLLAGWASAYSAAEFVTDDYWDEDFDDNMKCMLLRQATDTDGVVTFNFNGVQQELISLIEWLDPTAASLALAGQIRWLLYQIGEQGLNLFGATTAIEEADCSDCGTTWCWNSNDATDLSTWVHEDWNGLCDTGNAYSSGAWQSGTAWQTAFCTGIVVSYVRITMEFPTPIEIFDISAFSTEVPASRAIYVNGDATLFSGTAVWSNGSYTGGEHLVVERIDIIFARALNDTTPFGLEWVQMSGYGDNPFGENNC